MSTLLWIILGIVAILILWFIAAYNGLIKLKNRTDEAWSDIDVQLKRRYDLIPNLIETVKGYAAHEKEVLEHVTQLRAQCMASVGRPEEQAVDENQLVAALQHLLAVVENYPQLKADRNFLQLQQELVNTEDRIQAARRFYNGNIRDYRNRCETFPSNLVAGLFGFQPQEFFDVPPAVREVPDVGNV